MKTLIAALSLLIAGGLVSTPVEAHDRTVHVTATPVAGLAVWGNTGGHHGQSAKWTVGWSGAVSLGSLPVYPVPAYAVVPAPHAGHGPKYRHGHGHKRGHGHGSRHARKHSHCHH